MRCARLSSLLGPSAWFPFRFISPRRHFSRLFWREAWLLGALAFSLSALTAEMWLRDAMHATGSPMSLDLARSAEHVFPFDPRYRTFRVFMESHR